MYRPSLAYSVSVQRFRDQMLLASRMRNLGSSLRWAGAMQAMFNLGMRAGIDRPRHSQSDWLWDEWRLSHWRPNATGKPMPGSGE